MKFSKASTRNTWEFVAHATEQVRNGSLDPALSAWVNAQGFALDETVFSSTPAPWWTTAAMPGSSLPT